MQFVIYIVAGLGSALLSILEIAMVLRAVLSWIPPIAESAFYGFVCMVTEPVVAPIRALFDRLGWFANSPIDFSFMIAFFLVMIVNGLLSTFVPVFFF